MKKVFEKKDRRTELEKERDDAAMVLRTLTVGTEEYEKVLKEVETLDKMVAEEKRNKAAMRTVILTVGGTILQSTMFYGLERTKFIPKAATFIPKISNWVKPK